MTLQLSIEEDEFTLDVNQPTLAYQADRYQEYDHRTHVYKIGDTYIGSDEMSSRSAVLLDMTDPKNPRMVESTISLPEGVERLFLEVLSNAGDNVQKSRLVGIDPGKIIVKMDKHLISVRNNGRLIPIEIHPTVGIYVPEMIFGRLLTSDNYDQNTERTGAGRNGYGAKITNVYSHYFKVEIGDPQRKLAYTQEWQNNMKNRSEPVITEGYSGEPFVEVTYQMDQERFGYQEYPEEAFSLFAKHAADMAFNHRVLTKFNEVKLHFRNIKDFAKCRFGPDLKTLVHYEWPPGIPITTKKGGVIMSTDPNVLPSLEMCLVDTPREGKMVAFTNSMINSEGGVHVDAAIKAIQKPILSKINGAMNKGKRGKNGKAGPSLTAADLKRHISIIISYRAINAKFRGQTKEKLVSPKPRIKIEDKRFSVIGRWNLVDRLIRDLEAKQERSLSRTDGKRKAHINLAAGDDANWAGRGERKSRECTLVLTEGLSATNYAVILFTESGPSFRDKYGFLPLRGKLLNVTGAPKLQIAENTEIAALKEMMGLKEGTDYRDPKERKKLRYGKICIIADPDVDGKHILCLIINYLNQRFPSLLVNQMIYYIKAPIMRVQKKSSTIKFYSLPEYEHWKSQTPDADSWHHSYYKGLGTSIKPEIKDDYKTLYPVKILYDEYANQYLDLAFNPKRVTERKGLIERYVPDDRVERFEQEAISHLINFELIEFSVADVERSIPGFDGLKDSQRRILYAILTKWGKKIGKSNLESTKMKVASLGPYVSTLTYYHHGEVSLNEAIVKLARNYVGSNNLSHLVPHGDFGTRWKNGKDAAAGRYIHTYPMWWLRLIYRHEDDGILTMSYEEGNKRGYHRYEPIIPVALLNGCQGIATGFSTFIPPYNPMDLCIWIILRMNRLELPDLIPWYRGFTGEVKVGASRGGKRVTSQNENKVTLCIDSNGKIFANPTENIMDSDEEDDPIKEMGEDHLEFELGTSRCAVTNRKSVYTQGVYMNGLGHVTVTELPIGRSIHGYGAWLKKLLEAGKIKDIQNHSDTDNPHFVIFGMENPNLRTLRLERSFGLSNMVLLDENNRPKYYKNTHDLMETFYHHRLGIYQIRKEFVIKTKKQELVKLDNRIRFIRAVINRELIILKRRKEDIYPEMDRLQLPRELLKVVNFYQCTANQIEILTNQIAKIEAELTNIAQLQPVKIWETELVEFIQAYLKHHPDEVDRFVYLPLQKTVLSEYYRPDTNSVDLHVF